MEATTSRGLGFRRPYYHLARIYFTQAESKNGAPCRGFDFIKRFRLPSRRMERERRKGHAGKATPLMHGQKWSILPTLRPILLQFCVVWFPALGFITPVLSIRRRVASQQASLFYFAYSRLSLRCYLETRRVMCLFYGYSKCSRRTLA